MAEANQGPGQVRAAQALGADRQRLGSGDIAIGQFVHGMTKQEMGLLGNGQGPCEIRFTTAADGGLG